MWVPIREVIMRKTLSTILLLAVTLVLILTGCSTTIAIRTLVPAEVDVSGYKSMAVRSTIDNTKWIVPAFWNSYIPIRGGISEKYLSFLNFRSCLDFGVSSHISNTATKTVYKAVNTGFFKVLDPELTDSYVTIGDRNGNMKKTFLDAGVDAVLTTEISNLYYDEYIIQERSEFSSTAADGKYYPIYFYAVQKYEITISYRLTDVENNVIIASGNFSSGMREHKTTLGKTKNAAGDYEAYSYVRIPTASSLFEEQISTFASNFRNALSPHYVTEYFDFMPNKPKVKRLEPAYEALEDEKWGAALQIFADEYARSKHGAAGYNACILYFTTGERQKAYDLAQELYRTQSMTDALELYHDLKKIEEKENAATKQINSTEKSGSTGGSTGSLAGF